jgi:hypothetical protein
MRVNGLHGHSASGNREGQCREGNDLLHGSHPFQWWTFTVPPGLDGDAVIQVKNIRPLATQGSAGARKGA